MLSDSPLPALPATLSFRTDGPVGILQLTRPEKRNALNDETVAGLHAFFAAPPAGVRAVVLCAAGDHFSAGLDLSEMTEASTLGGLEHSMRWHRAFREIEFGSIPVVAVLQGAVVGGGLELAAAVHVRVAEASAFYALPEGQRGIYLGGGGSVRLPRLIGTSRVMDMLLTGRVYGASDGAAIGISQYLVENGAGLERGIAIARAIAANADASNFAIMHALPRTAESGESAYFLEALVASIAQNEPEAKRRMADFLDKRGAKVRPQ